VHPDGRGVLMKSHLMMALAASALLGCAAQKSAPGDDFGALQNVDEKSDAFSSSLKLIGSIDYGQTAAAVKYRNPPRYLAYKFGGHKGDKVAIDVTSKNGDAVAWLLDNSFAIVAKNDDAGASTLDSHIDATLPGNSDPAIITYYIVVRDYWLQSATFTVALAGGSPVNRSCTVDADCQRVRPDCCGIGAWTAVNQDSVQAFRDSLLCPARQICPAIAILDDHSVAECNNTTHTCEAVKPADVVCGGFRLTNAHSCPDSYVCRGDALRFDGPGKCQQSCGGIAGVQCRGFDEVCVDDPSDECDPSTGGADCGGLCTKGS